VLRSVTAQTPRATRATRHAAPSSTCRQVPPCTMPGSRLSPSWANEARRMSYMRPWTHRWAPFCDVGLLPSHRYLSRTRAFAMSCW
jgi:hypothetical protein